MLTLRVSMAPVAVVWARLLEDREVRSANRFIGSAGFNKGPKAGKHRSSQSLTTRTANDPETMFRRRPAPLVAPAGAVLVSVLAAGLGA